MESTLRIPTTCLDVNIHSTKIQTGRKKEKINGRNISEAIN